MKQDADFYRQRIAEADRDVGAATLANVRDRALRARNRWVELAEHEARTTLERDKHRLAKTVRDAARETLESAAAGHAAT